MNRPRRGTLVNRRYAALKAAITRSVRGFRVPLRRAQGNSRNRLANSLDRNLRTQLRRRAIGLGYGFHRRPVPGLLTMQRDHGGQRGRHEGESGYLAVSLHANGSSFLMILSPNQFS